MNNKKDSLINRIILRISLAAEIVAFLIVTLFLGFLVWVIVSAFKPSPAEEKVFEEKYETAKQKYDKYYQKIVSSQEVLDLIENWDDPELGMLVENIEDTKFEVSNLDIDNTRVTYWDKDSEYYIDPNAYYKAGFCIYENPRLKSDKFITDLCFYLVEDPFLSENNDMENED
ncbi:MAG: hypothetical protein J6P37_08615 [Lachnospiraceae bacterium]|nr:hypothetical protein [Lachnospiraceae bacterium]